MPFLPALFASITVLGATDADPAGGAACSSPVDCQLNGECSSGACVCDAAWKGANCSELNILPASKQNGYGSLGSNTSSWGAGVIYDPTRTKWIMQVDEMNMHCGLGTWGQNSHCILAESDTPAGPYSKAVVLVDSWCHGSSPGRDPVTGTWIHNHMGSGTVRGGACTVCSAGVTPHGAKKGPCADAGKVDSAAAVVANSSTGPWKAAPGLVNGANCEPFFTQKGELYMACPSGGHSTAPNCKGENAFLTMSHAKSVADALAGRFTHMPVRTKLAGTADNFSSVPTICFNWEDQNLWIDKRGNFHTLMHAFRGQPCEYPICDREANPRFCSAAGGHAYSENGQDWYVSPVMPYSPVAVWEDGTNTTFRARERPHLIFDPKQPGVPTHLINGVGDPGCGGNTGCPGADHTFSLVVPLGTDSAV